MSSPQLLWRRTVSDGSPLSPAQRIKADRTERGSNQSTPEAPQWVKEYIDGHDQTMAQSLQTKLKAELENEQAQQEQADQRIALEQDEERVAAEKLAAEQLEKDQAVARQVQEVEDVELARRVQAKIDDDLEKEHVEQMQQDLAMAQEAENAEQREIEAKRKLQMEADEELARKEQSDWSTEGEKPTAPQTTHKTVMSPEQTSDLAKISQAAAAMANLTPQVA